jgi:hypothetical protein
MSFDETLSSYSLFNRENYDVAVENSKLQAAENSSFKDYLKCVVEYRTISLNIMRECVAEVISSEDAFLSGDNEMALSLKSSLLQGLSQMLVFGFWRTYRDFHDLLKVCLAIIRTDSRQAGNLRRQASGKGSEKNRSRRSIVSANNFNPLPHNAPPLDGYESIQMSDVDDFSDGEISNDYYKELVEEALALHRSQLHFGINGGE